MKNLKMLFVLLMICLIVVFAIQNAETLEVKFLAWTFTLRRALMLFVVLAIGVVIGWTWRSLSRPRTDGRADDEPPQKIDG